MEFAFAMPAIPRRMTGGLSSCDEASFRGLIYSYNLPLVAGTPLDQGGAARAPYGYAGERAHVPLPRQGCCARLYPWRLV